MKIDSASYSLASSHLATVHKQSSESLRAWTGERRPDFEAGASTTGFSVSLSSAARASLAADIKAAMAASPAPPMPPDQVSEAKAIEETSDAVDNDPRLLLIKSMVEMLTGETVRVFSAAQLRHSEMPPAIADPQVGTSAASGQGPAARSAGFGIEYDFHAVHDESEQTLVSAEGSIKTAEGTEIRFKLDLSMKRAYHEETSVSVRAGDAVRKDPLVLNFNGTAAELSDQRFSFDLLGNGRTANLPMLAGGNGYLAIDRNGNGKIDSGRELFGPTTNSGFGELSLLDTDKNGWIDENDAAFSALRIWTPDARGAGTLETLAQKKLGALGLDSIASPFELRGAGNSDLGAIAASGVFLTEDGEAGSVQEVDLSV